MFSFLAKKASKSRITDKRILWTMPLSYVVLGGIAAFYPLIMGNGQVLAQWLFSGGGSAYLPLILVVKGLMVCLLLWGGSYGGTLTPSFTLGAGLGFLLTSCLEILAFAQSSSRNVTRCNRIFRNNFRCSSNWDSLSSRFYWSRRAGSSTTTLSESTIEDN